VIFSSRIESIYPFEIQTIVHEPIYKLVFLFVIILIAEYNLALALLCAIVFMFMINDIALLTKVNEGFIYGPAINSCSIYNKEEIEKDGTPFYPLHENERTKPLQSI
jgi:hypothetical protein